MSWLIKKSCCPQTLLRVHDSFFCLKHNCKGEMGKNEKRRSMIKVDYNMLLFSKDFLPG